MASQGMITIIPRWRSCDQGSASADSRRTRAYLSTTGPVKIVEDLWLLGLSMQADRSRFGKSVKSFVRGVLSLTSNRSDAAG